MVANVSQWECRGKSRRAPPRLEVLAAKSHWLYTRACDVLEIGEKNQSPGARAEWDADPGNTQTTHE